MTTIEVLDAGDRPAPPAPLRPGMAVLAIGLLLVGGCALAWLAGPEPRPTGEPEIPVSPLP